MKKILFVCTGNTCRSSMAEAIFNNMAKEKEDLNMKAESAGIEAIDGMSANDKAIWTLNHRGIDMSAHKSRRIRSAYIEESDLVLAMTRLHKIQILSAYPQANGKVFTLLEYAGENSKLDIADPYGQSHEIYERCADELEKSIRAAIEKLSKQ
jgi:protein-tyrosine-phosphatase